MRADASFHAHDLIGGSSTNRLGACGRAGASSGVRGRCSISVAAQRGSGPPGPKFTTHGQGRQGRSDRGVVHGEAVEIVIACRKRECLRDGPRRDPQALMRGCICRGRVPRMEVAYSTRISPSRGIFTNAAGRASERPIGAGRPASARGSSLPRRDLLHQRDRLVSAREARAQRFHLTVQPTAGVSVTLGCSPESSASSASRK
jgi:hypothetical protein